MRVVTELPKANGLRATTQLFTAEDLTDERILGALTALTYHGGRGTLEVPTQDWEFTFELEPGPTSFMDTSDGQTDGN